MTSDSTSEENSCFDVRVNCQVEMIFWAWMRSVAHRPQRLPSWRFAGNTSLRAVHKANSGIYSRLSNATRFRERSVNVYAPPWPRIGPNCAGVHHILEASRTVYSTIGCFGLLATCRRRAPLDLNDLRNGSKGRTRTYCKAIF
jgi:hypothetical protein